MKVHQTPGIFREGRRVSFEAHSGTYALVGSPLYRIFKYWGPNLKVTPVNAYSGDPTEAYEPICLKTYLSTLPIKIPIFGALSYVGTQGNIRSNTASHQPKPCFVCVTVTP